MPVQCPNCKSLNSDTADFCSSCGARLDGRSEQVTRAAPGEKPPSVPEDRVGTGTIGSSWSGAPVQGSGVGSGVLRRSHTWLWYWAFVLGVGFTSFLIVANTDDPLTALGASAVCGGIALVLGFPIAALWSKSRYSEMGIVTHLHEELTARLWVFNLQRTDRNWLVCQDRRGFLLPVVEVVFRSDTVHGPPLEEGSRVILRGRRKGGRVHARSIWNVTPGVIPVAHGQQEVFWGRVTNLSPARQVPDMRYPGQGRSVEVWSFRLQVTDENFRELLRDVQGNLRPAVPVEICGQSISGPLQEGDKVEISGHVVRGTLHAREVRNHSARGALLVVKGLRSAP